MLPSYNMTGAVMYVCVLLHLATVDAGTYISINSTGSSHVPSDMNLHLEEAMPQQPRTGAVKRLAEQIRQLRSLQHKFVEINNHVTTSLVVTSRKLLHAVGMRM